LQVYRFTFEVYHQIQKIRRYWHDRCIITVAREHASDINEQYMYV